MTIKKLKEIISNLPEETIVQIEETNVNEIGIVNIVLHSDGRKHVILSASE